MKTEYQKCMDGEFFTADSEMLQIVYRCKRLVRSLNGTDMENISERKKIIGELFGSVGNNVHIDIDFHCEYGINIHCGSDVIINMNCTFVDNNRINIGNNVLIASDVKIYTATHTTDVAGSFNLTSCFFFAIIMFLFCYRYKYSDLFCYSNEYG